jgi:hypothetical protein
MMMTILWDEGMVALISSFWEWPYSDFGRLMEHGLDPKACAILFFDFIRFFPVVLL